MVSHPKIPAVVRFGIPLAICLNIAFFISSNLSVGATVFMVVTMGNEQLTLPPLFTFSLADSVRDMWDARNY